MILLASLRSDKWTAWPEHVVDFIGPGSPAPNCGTGYSSGTVVQLTATANAGHTFSSWSGDATGSANPTSITMNSAKTVTANFAVCYTLSKSASPLDGGTVTANPTPNCGAGYVSGTAVQLTANANAGYWFANWGGDASGTSNPLSVTMNNNKAVTANFSQAMAFVQVSTGDGYDNLPGLAFTTSGRLVAVWERSGGSIWQASSLDQGATWSPQRLVAPVGAHPALLAAADGRLWLAYRQDADIWVRTSTDQSESWTSEINLTAGGGDDQNPALTQTSDGTLWLVWGATTSEGTVISFKHSIDNGASWTVDRSLLMDPAWCGATSITQSADGKLWIVWFQAYDFQYSTSSDNGVTWTTSASLGLGGHSPRLRTATDGKMWFSWGGLYWADGAWRTDLDYQTSTDNGATWSPIQQYTIFNGENSSPDMAALPGGQVAFVWSSNRTGAANIWFGRPGVHADTVIPPSIQAPSHSPAEPSSTQVVAFTAAIADVADVSSAQLRLTVDGVQQPDQEIYDNGVPPDVTAGDGVYTGRGGPYSAGTRVVYQFRATNTQGLSALTPPDRSFVISGCYTLVKNANPPAGGSVNTSLGPNCGGGTGYTSGTVVQLTAAANAGYTFANWSGSASGTTNPTTVTMDSNKTVTANFSGCYTLVKNADPSAGGSVSASPGPNCGGGTGYTSGTVVQLTAAPSAGYRFDRWSGDVTGTTNPTSVLMTSDKAVTATFVQEGGVALSLSPSASSVAVGQIWTVEIRADLGEAAADTIDAYINFDPTFLEVVDTSGNPVTSIELNMSVFGSASVNTANNTSGEISFSASKYDSPYLTAGIKAATIRFKAKAAVPNTVVAFVRSGARWSDILLAGDSLNPKLSGNTTSISSSVTLNGQVALERRGAAGDPRWVTELYRVETGVTAGGIEIYAAGTVAMIGRFSATTDSYGAFSATLTGLEAGVYDIKVKASDTLSRKKSGVSLPSATAVNFGTLLVGDSNGNDAVNGGDISYMIPSFLKCSGDPNYRPYADTNRDVCVNGADVSSLIPNFLETGPLPASALLSEENGWWQNRGASTAASLTLSPTTRLVEVDDVFVLDIVANTESADTVDAYINFDPAYLEIVDASGQPATSIETNLAVFDSATYNTVDNASGQIDFSASKFTTPYLSGSFTVATIRFRSKAAVPTTDVLLVQSGVRWGDLYLAGDALDATLTDSQVTTVARMTRVYLPLVFH